MTSISVLIPSYGDPSWDEIAERPYNVAARQLTEDDEVTRRYEPDGTLASVRNTLAEEARGDWLCFVDADDELAPGYLAAMRRAARPRALLAPALELVGSGPPKLPNRHHPMTVLNHCAIGTLVERDLFLEVGGFREDLASLEDWELWLRCVRAGAQIVDVPDAVYRASPRPRSRNADQTAYKRIRAEHGAA